MERKTPNLHLQPKLRINGKTNKFIVFRTNSGLYAGNSVTSPLRETLAR